MQNKVATNATWIIGCKIVQSLINLVIGMISARYLGPSNYGLINYASSIVAFILPVMQLGLSKTLVWEFIERPEKQGQVLGTALTLNLLSAIACMGGIYWFLSVANAGETETICVGVLYSISLIFQATEMIQYWFQAKLLSKYPSMASLVAYIGVALYKIYLLVTQKGVEWFAISSVLDYLLISIILMMIYHKMSDQRLSFSKELGKEMLRRSRYYIVSTMMISIFAQTDRIMLKLMINETQTGYYSAAIACVGISSFVFTAIIDSMRPTILEAKKTQSPNYEARIIQLYSVITYLSLLQSVIMTLLAKFLVVFLYGEDYLSSVDVVRVAVWYTTFSYYGSVRNIWILAENKQKYLWIINLSGALLNVIINALLIPICGALGAAIASLGTQFFANVIVGYIIKPIRYNNYIMMRGLDPRPIMRYAKTYLKKVGRK